LQLFRVKKTYFVIFFELNFLLHVFVNCA